MYIRRDTNYNSEKIVNMHLNAFLGKIEKIDPEIMDDFFDTLRYCIIEGCYKNFEFAKYCKKNYVFENDMEYQLCIKTAYLLNGENVDISNLSSEDMLMNNLSSKDAKIYDPKLLTRFYKSLFKIREKNLEKLVKYESLSIITSYLTILHKNERLFRKIKNPVLTRQCKGLIQYYGCPNYFNEEFKKLRSTATNDFPVYIERNYPSHKDLDIELFERRITYDRVEYFYMGCENGSFQDCCRIKNLEKYVLNETNWEEKFETTGDIIDNIKCTQYAIKYKKFKNLYCSKILYVDPEYAWNIIKEEKPFIYYINKSYDLFWISSFEKLGEQFRWIIIYSNIKSAKRVDEEYIKNEKYIEYNCYVEAVKTKNQFNLKCLKEHYKKHKKCFKILDFEKERYIKQEIVLNLDEEYQFDIKEYLPEFLNLC